MKELNTKQSKVRDYNLGLLDKPMTQDEFLNAIRNAENGPFYTVEESMAQFELWQKSREKK